MEKRITPISFSFVKEGFKGNFPETSAKLLNGLIALPKIPNNLGTDYSDILRKVNRTLEMD